MICGFLMQMVMDSSLLMHIRKQIQLKERRKKTYVLHISLTEINHE